MSFWFSRKARGFAAEWSRVSNRNRRLPNLAASLSWWGGGGPEAILVGRAWEGKEGRKPSDAAAAAQHCDTPAADNNFLPFHSRQWQQTVTAAAAAEIKLVVEKYWAVGKSWLL